MAVLCAFLVVACYYDYTEGRIPNVLLVFLLVIGLGRNFYIGGIPLLLDCLISVLIMMAVMYPLFKIGTLGAGDVKLIGICGGYLPSDKILLFLFFSMLIAASISLIRLIKEHNLQERFSYFCEYMMDVLKSGQFRLYIEDGLAKRRAGICLSGPILCSVLMCWGGIY